MINRMISLCDIILLSLIVLSALIAVRILNRAMKDKGFKVNERLNTAVILIVTLALCTFGISIAWIVKGIAFALILLYASVQDRTNREADNCLFVMILLLCLCNASRLSLSSMLGGFGITFVPTLAMTVLCTKGFGGADIKIAGASGLMLGFAGGAVGYIAGLLFSVIFNLIYNKVKGRDNSNSFPMLPFLSAGLMLGYFIN